MRHTFEVLVTLKPGLADPQGKAVEASLPALGFADVSDVHVGRHVRLEVEASPAALESGDRGLPGDRHERRRRGSLSDR